jgi:hypothetical protein
MVLLVVLSFTHMVKAFLSLKCLGMRHHFVAEQNGGFTYGDFTHHTVEAKKLVTGNRIVHPSYLVRPYILRRPYTNDSIDSIHRQRMNRINRMNQSCAPATKVIEGGFGKHKIMNE